MIALGVIICPYSPLIKFMTEFIQGVQWDSASQRYDEPAS